MQTDSMNPDWEQLLYQYYKENGGYLVGNPYNASRYPECHLILDLEQRPIVLGTVITSASQYGCSLAATAQVQLNLNYPYHLTIQPMNLLKRGIDAVMKEDIHIQEKEFDRKYLIRSDNPDFTREVLPGSTLVRLLLTTKYFHVKVAPMANDPHLHTLTVTSTLVLRDELIGKAMDEAGLKLMIDICREACEALTRYPMQTPATVKGDE